MTNSRTQGESGEAGSERELKFLVDGDTLAKALAAPGYGGGPAAPAWRTLRTVYFDTDDGDLARAKVALRVRQSDKGRVMSLKRAAGGDAGAFEREETETPVDSAEPDLSRFGRSLAREIAELTGGKPLAPRFGSEIRRAARVVDINGATIEIAFDDGFLFAGPHRAPTTEIEFELKSGPPSALFDLGLGFVDAFPARLGLQSKAERAHALLAPGPPEPVHAHDPALDAGMSLDAAIGAIARNCLGHCLGNLPAFEGGDKVEALHQMRVGMRRLRSALDLFGKAFPTPELDRLRAEGRRIGAALGEARDWDVFVGRLRAGALSRFGREPGFGRFVEAALARADTAHRAAAALVDDRTVDRFALRLERFVAARGWRDSADPQRRVAFEEPVEAFAARSLARLDRRMRKRGRGFRSLDQPARHRLRIAIKHMRYATEFFGGLFDAGDAGRFSAMASDFQDTLGDRNDAVTALRLVSDLGPAPDSDFAHVSGLVAGWSARESEDDAEALAKDWRRLAKAAASWSDVYGRAP